MWVFYILRDFQAKIIICKVSLLMLMCCQIIYLNNAPIVQGVRRERIASLMTEGTALDRRKSLPQAHGLIERKYKREVIEESYTDDDISVGKYGIIGFNNNNDTCPRKRYPLVSIRDVNEHCNDKLLCVQGRLHTSRARGKRCFVVVRQQGHTIQCFLQNGPSVSTKMLKFVSKINRESIIKVFGKIQTTSVEIKSCTSKWVEVLVEEVWIVSESEILPIQVIDCARKEKSSISKKSNKDELNICVSQDKKLDHRILDLRTPANQAIFRLESVVSQLFRQCLTKKGFIEIHTPKIISSASESGANVFEVPYFKTTAFLAQSPQLYKQMAIASDFEKVFTVGSVFRAENSHTSRHLTEFIGLDLEMVFENHYSEVLDVVEQTFVEIFQTLQSEYKEEITIVSEQFDAEPFEFIDPPPRITYSEAKALLKEENIPIDQVQELTPQLEKLLGSIIKKKFKTDFFVLDKYPISTRPFYTMSDPDNANLSNSYDIFMRGEEVMSGAQRIHNASMLREAAIQHGIDVNQLHAYIDAFRFGCAPHAGGGIGLERTLALYLGLDNVRKTSMFPRDPARITP